MNNVSLIGRLTKTPEVKHLNDKKVCNFTLALSEGYGDSERTIFVNCQAWNKTAEFIEKYFDKGVRIAINGRINVRNYEKDGSKVFITEIVAEKVYFADGKRESNQAPAKRQETFEVYDVNAEDLPF